MFRRLAVAIFASGALVASLLTPSDPARAESQPPAAAASAAGFTAPVDERDLIAEHSSVELDEVELEGRLTGPIGGTTTEFDLSLDDEGEGTVTLDDGAEPAQELALAVETATPERLAFTLTDSATGESFDYDSSKPMKRIVFVIPVAFAAVSVATALYYIAVGTAIVVGGMLALEAGKAIGKIVAANNKKPAAQRRNYYPAYRQGEKKLMILPKGYTKAQALAKGRVRHDVWALSRSLAKSLARDLNRSGKPIGPEAHKGGVAHYHPYKKAPGMHSFYGAH